MNISEYLIFRHTLLSARNNININYKEQNNVPDINTIESKLKDSVKKIYDFSCFVSGGVDSSLLAAITKPKKIYCAVFPGYKNTEDHWAKIVAEHIGAELVPVEIKKYEYLSTLEYLIRSKQDGLHPNEPCLFIVAKRAAKDGIKLMLSGEGADDIFGGYTDLLENGDKYFENKETFLKRYAYARPSKYGLVEEIEFEEFKKWGMERFILEVHTPGLIKRARNACFSAGVNVLFPYLDSGLPQYMWDCKKEYKNNKNTLKVLAEKYLPKEIVYRSKIGFPVPLDEWLGDGGIERFLLLNINIWKSI